MDIAREEIEKLLIKQYFKDKQKGAKEVITISKQDLFRKLITMVDLIKNQK